MGADDHVVMSIFDRLVNTADKHYRDREDNYDLAERFEEAVLRDIAALLNTRRPEAKAGGAFPQCDASILTYGIPDFSSYSLRSKADQNKLRRAIELALRRFEPRLSQVAVTLEPRDAMDPVLTFRVSALLLIEPAPEPVTFDTVLTPETGKFHIRPRG
jgi:type VI secretion system protein ImpF